MNILMKEPLYVKKITNYKNSGHSPYTHSKNNKIKNQYQYHLKKLQPVSNVSLEMKLNLIIACVYICKGFQLNIYVFILIKSEEVHN